MNERTTNKTIRILYILASCILIFKLFDMDRYVSICFYASVFTTIILWVECNVLTKIDWLMLGMLWLALINVLISTAINSTILSVNYIEKYIHFASTCIFFSAASKISIDKKTAALIRRLNSVTVLVFTATYVLFPLDVYVLGGRITKYLTFRFDNPNAVALFLLCMFIREFLTFVAQRGFLKKTFHLALSVIVLFFISQTQSRTVLIAALVFLVLHIFLTARKKQFVCMSPVLIWGIVLMPLLFVVIYLTVVNTSWIADLFSFMVEEGKELDSRLGMWTHAFEYISASPIIGSYATLGTLTEHLQMHNTHLDVWVSYGVVVVALFCVFLYTSIRTISLRHPARINVIELIGFFAALLVGTGEAALVSGGLGIYVFIGSFLLIANSNTSNDAQLQT